jgi:patatin-like phospholipase/acyl hydrolase
MKKILTIDGGGIRGIVPGIIIRTLEQKIQGLTHNPEARIVDYIDFIAGTSTGGILACLYLCPDEHTGRPKFSAADAVNLYIENGDEIFEIPRWKKIQSMGGVNDERYDTAPLENLLRLYFSDITLAQLIKPCLITSYDIKNRRAHLFNQSDARSKGDAYNFFLRDVCRATSAAPTYFETALVRSLSNISYPLIDGGVFVNNPAMCAYSEVRNAKADNPEGKITAKDMFILSLGTGAKSEPYDYKTAKDWGMVSWLTPLIDIMMSGASEVTDYYLIKMFDAIAMPERYVRITPTTMYNADTNMANASKQNIDALVELGTLTAQEHDSELTRIAKILINDGKDDVEFV